MKNKKSVLDTLAEKPTFTLSYDSFGSETWSTKERITERPVMAGDRNVWQNVKDGLSSDQLILKILKMNPRIELQLLGSYGHLPQFTLHLNGTKVKNLKLPDEVFYVNRAIWVKWEQHDVNLCLLDIR